MTSISYSNVMLLPGALLSGLTIYFIFSYLFISTKITLPAPIIIFVLVFVLSKYYASGSNWSSSNRAAIITADNNNDGYSTDSTRGRSAIGPTALHELSTDNQKVDDSNNERYNNNNDDDGNNNNKSNRYSQPHLTNFLFVIGYIIALLIVVIGSLSSTLFRPNMEEIEALKLFVPWQQQFNSIDSIIELAAAIALSFFLPGYALVCSVLLKEEKGIESTSSNNRIATQPRRRRQLQQLRSKSLLKVLLGYILSMFITGSVGYIVASFGMPVSGINIVLPLVIIYAIILIVFVLQTKLLLNNKKNIRFNLNLFFKSNFKAIASLFIRKNNNNPTNRSISPEIILVFLCLFALVVLSTYYLYGGVIIGDQWFHHGRALMFISGTFKDIANSAQDDLYPPFFSAFLAAFISLSGNPSVNAYASISFLNIMPVLAFYYFFTNWVPNKWSRAALLACTLFVLSGGFGWLYALSMASGVLPSPYHSSTTTIPHPVITSYVSSLDILHIANLRTVDIIQPSNFILVAYPDFSTGLQLIVLPIGFVLLGLLKEGQGEGDDKVQQQNQKRQRIWQQTNYKNNKKNNFNIEYFVIVTLLSLLGILSHDETYLFIIILSIIPIIFGLPNKHFVYAGFLAAIAITFLVDRIYLENYFTSTLIFGLPLLYLSFLFVGFIWALYTTKTYVRKLFSTTSIRSPINKFAAILKLKRIGNNDNSSSCYSSSSDVRMKLRITLAIVIALVVVYWYIFTFIVWAEIPPNELRSQTFGYNKTNLPWYLFPMKLGVTGLVGLSFVLSYLFRKFQKELFVFGLIIIMALFAGPYYDEQRFSKYIMVGMVGFASLLIYRIISSIFRTKEITTTRSMSTAPSNEIPLTRNNGRTRKTISQFHKPLICGLVIGSVITISSLSVLLYLGYDASALLTHNFRWAEPDNVFPSSSELNMFRFINNHLSDLKIYNIALMAKQYILPSALSIDKIHGFTTIPQSVLVRSPLALNSSTLEGFYNLLNKSNTRFIIVPIDIIAKNGVGAGEQGATTILQFVLNNFQRVYEDKNYVLLALPPSLTPPSSSGNAALVYPKNGYLPMDNSYNNNSHNDKGRDESKTLLYNNQSFDKIDHLRFIKTNKDKTTAVLYGNKSQTLWSRSIIQKGENVSYIEATFRILQENNRRPDNSCGIAWDDGIKKYYASLTKDKLQFSQTNSKAPFTFQDQGIKTENLVWYKLRILFLSKSTVDIYMNDLLKLRIPKTPYLPEVNNITSHKFKVGIRCSGKTGQFGQLQIGLIPSKVTESELEGNKNQDYDKNISNYFYALNTVALSKIGYDTFLDGDYSAFSKKNIILTFDPTDQEEVDRYLKYAKTGGTLIVINSDYNKINGGFSKLLGIQAVENLSKFNGIGDSHVIQQLQKQPYSQDQHYFRVSGVTRDMQFRESNDVKVLSFYLNNNITSARFAIEKDYNGGGKIIFVNAGGYFEAISKSPYHYFGTLSDFPSLIALKSSKSTTETYLPPTGSIVNARYIGNATISGQTVINSSSFLLSDPSGVGSNNNMYIKDVSLSSNHDEINYDYNNTKLSDNITQHPKAQLQTEAANVDPSEYIAIKDLKVFGPYQVIINSTGRVYLPSTLSYSNYISISIPSGFNMTLKLLRGASVEFTITGLENYTRHIRINVDDDDYYRIQFYRMITDNPQIKYIPVLMKSPEIKANGNTSFGRLYRDVADYYSYGIKGWPTQFNGNLSARVDHVDHYDTSGKRSYTKNFLTYLEWVKTDENKKTKTMTTTIQDQLLNLRIPGDIHYVATQASSRTSWQQAAASNTNIWVIIALLLITTIGMRLLWPRIMKTI